MDFNKSEKSWNQKIFFLNSLGAPHDGTGVSVNCPQSSNYLMTVGVGKYDTNQQNLFLLSSCSINSIKTLLLSANVL